MQIHKINFEPSAQMGKLKNWLFIICKQKSMKSILLIFLFLFSSANYVVAGPVDSAKQSPSSNMLVLDYHDFGVQAAAYELLGMEWWQWLPHGDSDPATEYGIKVVVYKDVELQEVEKAYPVVPEKNQDFRYLDFDTAMRYLDAEIEENVLPEITERLQETRDKLVAQFGE